jgi:hypothetical protein
MQQTARVFKRKVIAFMRRAESSNSLGHLARRLVTPQLMRKAVRQRTHDPRRSRQTVKHPILTCGLLLAVAGCSTPVDPALLVETAVSISPTSVHPSDTVVVSVSAANRTGRTLQIGYANGCALGYEVVDSSGEVVFGPDHFICTAASWTLTLVPGEVLSREYRWSPASGSGRTGLYEIRGGLHNFFGLRNPTEPVQLLVLE